MKKITAIKKKYELIKRYPFFKIVDPVFNETGKQVFEIRWRDNIRIAKEKVSVEMIKQLDVSHRVYSFCLYLAAEYPYLYFTENSILVSDHRNKDAYTNFIGLYDIKKVDHGQIKETNKKAKQASLDPSNYFWCVVCQNSKPMKYYGGFILNTSYCQPCVDVDENLRRNLEESKEKGFYE